MKTDNEKYISHVQEAIGEYAHVKENVEDIKKRPKLNFHWGKNNKTEFEIIHWMRWNTN